jgi:rhomboid family GlyGly-CTERM serine protease
MRLGVDSHDVEWPTDLSVGARFDCGAGFPACNGSLKGCTTKEAIAPPSLKRWATRLISFLLISIAPLLHVFPRATSSLQFDRPAVAAGQFWRLLTCHWTHWSADHLFWSAGTFALLILLARRIPPRRLLVSILAAAFAITAAVTFFTDLRFYRGLSGIDSTLFILIAVQILREKLSQRRRLAACATLAPILAFVAKIIYESATTRAVFVDAPAAGMLPVPLAHLVGGAVGLLYALLPVPICEFRLPNRSHLRKITPRATSQTTTRRPRRCKGP